LSDVTDCSNTSLVAGAMLIDGNSTDLNVTLEVDGVGDPAGPSQLATVPLYESLQSFIGESEGSFAGSSVVITPSGDFIAVGFRKANSPSSTCLFLSGLGISMYSHFQNHLQLIQLAWSEFIDRAETDSMLLMALICLDRPRERNSDPLCQYQTMAIALLWDHGAAVRQTSQNAELSACSNMMSHLTCGFSLEVQLKAPTPMTDLATRFL